MKRRPKVWGAFLKNGGDCMRKVVFIAFVVVTLALFFSSCGVSPEEAMQNIQNPNVEFKTSVKIPLVATSVEMKDVVGDFLSNTGVESSLPFDIEFGSPVVLRYSTSVVIASKEELESINDNLKGQNDEVKVAKVSVDVPEINANSEISAQIDLPSPREQNVSIYIPGVPRSTSYPYATTTVIDLGITSDKVASITADGNIEVSYELPSEWEEVKVTEFSLKVYSLLNESGNSSKLVYEDSRDNTSGLSTPISFTFADKDIEIGVGKLTLEYTLKIENQSSTPYSSGTISLSITPSFTVKAFKDANVGERQEISIPESVKDILLKDGTVVISSNEISFTGVAGFIEYGDDKMKGFIVNDEGELEVDLNGLSLPATVVINKISGKFVSDAASEITLDVNIKNPEASVVLDMGDEKLSFEGSEVIELPEDFTIKNIVFSSGYINLIYKSNLPVDVNVKLWSPQLKDRGGNEFEETITIENGEKEETILNFSDYDLVPDGTELVIYYSASPVGYDPESSTLEIENITLDNESYTFEASVSFGDISLKEVTIGDISQQATGELDLNVFDSEDAKIVDAVIQMLKTMDISGTITFNMDISGSLEGYLASYDESGNELKKENIAISMESGILKLDEVFNVLRGIISTSDSTPSLISYDLKANIDELTVNFDSLNDATMTFELEAPLSFKFDSAMLVWSKSDKVSYTDLPENATLTEATLLIEGTNTTGINLEIDVTINEKVYKVNAMGSEVDGTVKLSAEDIEKMKKDGLPYEVEVWLPKGDYTLSSDGELDIKMKIAADVVVGTK